MVFGVGLGILFMLLFGSWSWLARQLGKMGTEKPTNYIIVI